MPRIATSTEKKVSPEFQQRLLELIEEKECSVYKFASFVGVSKEVILHATTYGIIPSLKPLIKIADKLEISLPYLLGENYDPYFYKAEIPSSFAIRMQQLISENNTKYSQVAHTMPFPESYFYEWRRERTTPSLEYLKAIAEYFKVSIDYLLGRTD